MPVIKRYPNRKLYNTEAKQYVTLEGIASLVREGQAVRVVDHATGEDLTTLTLTQIVLDQEKKAGGFVPNTVLSGLVKQLCQKLTAQSTPLKDKPLPLEQEVKQVLDRRGLPTHEDYQRLARKLDALAAKLDRLGSGEQPAASPRRPRRKRA